MIMIYRFSFWLLIIFSGFFTKIECLEDLEEKTQDFVIETKQILISEFPTAFNPSIVDWKGFKLLSFRIRDGKKGPTNKVGLVFLDENFNPSGNPYVLNMPKDYSLTNTQDPRLIVCGEHLYIIYNDIIKKLSGYRRMFIGRITFDEQKFFLEDPEPILQYGVVKPNRHEKNWVPFIYKDQLLLTYSIIPHIILRPLLNHSYTCAPYCESRSNIIWNFGELRGGTAAGLINDNEYLAFFHSCKDMATVQSEGKYISHYFMGAYTFSAKPPFEISRISLGPIFGKGFYEGIDYDYTWKPLHVVFPGGFVHNDKYFWVVYGKQDHELWVVKLDKEELLKSLVPVHTEKTANFMIEMPKVFP